MELPLIYYNKEDVVETPTGIRVHNSSHIYGAENIMLGGKDIIEGGCIIRGDLKKKGQEKLSIILGRYCYLNKNIILRPPYKFYKGIFSYYQIKIGDFVTIGESSVISAAMIGSFVTIGKNCVIGRFSFLKDCCKIEDNTVIPPNTVVPPFSIFAGNPGRQIGQLGDFHADVVEARSKEQYMKYVRRG